MLLGDNDSYEARAMMMPSDWPDQGHRGHHPGAGRAGYMDLATGADQRLSDMIPDIAMAGQYCVRGKNS